MKIRQFGGEFKLIDDLTASFKNRHNVALTVGDDAAVIEREGYFEVVTTDVLVENHHFTLDHHSPYQVGSKTLEVNVSDVVAMGADPELLLLNLVLPGDIDVEWVREVYRAIREGCDRYGITLIGGDTTGGPCVMLGATLTGRADKPVFRSGAKVGDAICVTGDVGAAAAGLKVFLTGQKPEGPVLQRHLEPRCRYDLGPTIASRANSMIDVSDGVAPEVRRICERSGVGAVVDARKLPILPETAAAAAKAGTTGVACALSGGEDFELLFTLPPAGVRELRQDVRDFTVIGGIVDAAKGIHYVDSNKHLRPMPSGWDHFLP